MKIESITLIHNVTSEQTIHFIEKIYDMEFTSDKQFVLANKKNNLIDKFLVPIANIRQIKIRDEEPALKEVNSRNVIDFKSK